MSDQILLPAVDGAMHRISAAVAHDEDTGGTTAGGQIRGQLARMAASIDRAIRAGSDRPVQLGAVEWVMTGGEAAETMARAAVVICEMALAGNAEGDMEHGEYVAYGVLALALECGVIAHRPEASQE